MFGVLTSRLLIALLLFALITLVLYGALVIFLNLERFDTLSHTNESVRIVQ